MTSTPIRRTRYIVAALVLVITGALAGFHAVSNASSRSAEPVTVGKVEVGNSDADGDLRAHVDIDGFANWVVLDRDTGGMAGENLKATSTPQSMIKPWLIADYLTRSAETAAAEPPLLSEASAAIRVSDDVAAQTIYEANGGDVSIRRLIDTCGLTDTTVFSGRWSKTEMSVRDAARMGACVADGRAAGEWTDWLLDEMRHVEGTAAPTDQHATSGGGRWGIIDGLPESLRDEVAIKNGWTRMADGDWDVNCLAVHDDWVLVVMLGYSGDRELQYGAERCRDIAGQLFGA